MTVRDRREEFHAVPWQQGRLLFTRLVASMPEAWRAEQRKREARSLFAHFTPLDEGRGRVLLYVFDTPLQCAAAVFVHNALLLKSQE